MEKKNLKKKVTKKRLQSKASSEMKYPLAIIREINVSYKMPHLNKYSIVDIVVNCLLIIN